MKNKLLHTLRVYYQPWTVTLDDLSSVPTEAAPLSFHLLTNQKPTCKTTPFCPCPLGKNLVRFPENKTCSHFLVFDSTARHYNQINCPCFNLLSLDSWCPNSLLLLSDECCCFTLRNVINSKFPQIIWLC